MKHNTNCRWFYNGGECLIEVNPLSLIKPAHNSSRFATLEGPIGVYLVHEDPLSRDEIGARWARDKSPRPIGGEGVKFIFHGM